MPREQLVAFTADVDRLLAAGASAAVGNDSLRRRCKTLRDLGQKVAALNPVADAIDRVTQAAPSQAAPALLDLVVLSRRIRASLATAGVTGDLELLPESGPWRTPLPVRDVPPLIQALTQSGPGREELLKSTLERNAFGDLRLVSGLLEALDDGHAPIAELVAREALPAHGRAVLPDLRAGLNLQGKTADARRLLAICRIDASMGASLCRRALSEGSQPVRVQALECLPDVAAVEEAEQSGLSLRLDKNRDVRAAAVWSLRNSSSGSALDALVEALVGDKDEQVQRRSADALAVLRNPKTTKRLLDVLQTRLAEEPNAAEAPKKPGQKDRVSGGAGSEHLRTTSLLIEAIGSRRDKQRVAAAEALLPLARGKQARLRHAALSALGAMGAVTREVVPTLAEAVADKNDLIAQAAAGALGRLPAEEREEALSDLLRFFAKAKGKYRAVHCAMLPTLTDHMDRHGPAVLEALAAGLKQDDWRIQFAINQAVVKIGAAARPLLPDIMAVLKKAQAYYHVGHDSLLAALDPDGTTVIPELVGMLSARKPGARVLAMSLLAPYGLKAREALPLIEKLCEDKEYYVRQAADRALAAIR